MPPTCHHSLLDIILNHHGPRIKVASTTGHRKSDPATMSLLKNTQAIGYSTMKPKLRLSIPPYRGPLPVQVMYKYSSIPALDGMSYYEDDDYYDNDDEDEDEEDSASSSASPLYCEYCLEQGIAHANDRNNKQQQRGMTRTFCLYALGLMCVLCGLVLVGLLVFAFRLGVNAYAT